MLELVFFVYDLALPGRLNQVTLFIFCELHQALAAVTERRHLATFRLPLRDLYRLPIGDDLILLDDRNAHYTRRFFSCLNGGFVSAKVTLPTASEQKGEKQGNSIQVLEHGAASVGLILDKLPDSIEIASQSKVGKIQGQLDAFGLRLGRGRGISTSPALIMRLYWSIRGGGGRGRS